MEQAEQHSGHQATPEPSELPEILREQRKLDDNDRFCFACHPALPCFNTCCRDVNIMLTPLDILCLARSSGMSTTEFLERNTLNPITKDLHLPVVILKMDDTAEKRCPFLTQEGCRVYDDRPWACRMYPVGMGIPPARAGVEPQPVHVLLEDDFCKGRDQASEWTLESWRADQKLVEREALEQGYRELVAHPWFIGGRQLNPAGIEMFFMVTYDLDRFRRFVFDSSFLKRFEIEEDLVTQLRDDDQALMRFGWRWLRHALFAEPTVTLREGAQSGECVQ